MDSVLLDLRFALRSLLRRRTFAIVAISTIALSIGAATAIYSLVDGVLFRSLPYANPGQLVAVWQTHPLWKKEPILAKRWDRVPLDYTAFMNWRVKQTSFIAVGAWAGGSALLTGSAEPEQVTATRVSPSLFAALGVTPIMGRAFLPGEDVMGGPHLTIISYESWQSRFGGRSDVVGRTVGFDGVPYTIVGVLPRGFSLERGLPGAPFWIPAGQSTGDVGHQNHYFRAVARLKPGVSLEQATTESAQLLLGLDDPAKTGLRLAQYQIEETREVRQPLLVLFGAVGLLLLMACVNMATLLLGEAAAREQEMGARLALGATRGRIVAQLLTESVVLSLIGGGIGAALAWLGTRVLVAFAPDRIPGIHAVRVDTRVLAVSLLVAAITGVLFGLLPAFTLSRHAPSLTMRGGGQSAAGRGQLQRVLVAVELALSVLLLVGAALLSRSLSRLTAVDPGFRSEGLVAIRFVLPRGALADEPATRAFYAAATARLASLPGVTAVTETNGVPFSGYYSSSGYWLAGEDSKNIGRRHTAQQRSVAPGYFDVMGMPLRAGRPFTAQDKAGSQLVAMLSEAAARRDWPGESPIGKQISYQGRSWLVIGIVADSKYIKLGIDDEPTIYTTVSQMDEAGALLIRVRGAASTVIPEIRRTLQATAPTMAITKIDRMEDLIRTSFAEERFRTVLISLFGVMAGVLAVVGMYGVTARAVGRRTRELGIRVALGATNGSVVRLIVRNTLAGVVAGVAVGLVLSLVASRVLAPYLFGVTMYDPVTYAGTFALLTVASVFASWLPARRAGRLQPAAVLRGE